MDPIPTTYCCGSTDTMLAHDLSTPHRYYIILVKTAVLKQNGRYADHLTPVSSPAKFCSSPEAQVHSLTLPALSFTIWNLTSRNISMDVSSSVGAVSLRFWNDSTHLPCHSSIQKTSPTPILYSTPDIWHLPCWPNWKHSYMELFPPPSAKSTRNTKMPGETESKCFAFWSFLFHCIFIVPVRWLLC